MRQPRESVSQFAIRVAWETGHFWNPSNPDGLNITQEDLVNLRADDPVVIAAMISMSKMEPARYAKHVLEQHGRGPDFDGVIGPAIAAMVSEPNGRCPVPDFAPPPGVSFQFDDPDLQLVVERMQLDAVLGASRAFGSGNWNGCHDVGQFHCAAIGVNLSGVPAFLSPLLITVLRNVQRAYAGVGLLFRFINASQDMLTGESFSGQINSDMSFVSSSSGWIGLAIVGQGETCGSKIWCKFLSTYKGGSDNAAIVTQWTTLIKHELGHNCGRSHTSGGVMNPSIVNNLPVDWVANDPSTSWLKGQFGGVPVPIPGAGPTPPPAPNPPTDFEQRLRALELKDVVHQVTLDYYGREIKKIKEQIG